MSSNTDDENGNLTVSVQDFVSEDFGTTALTTSGLVTAFIVAVSIFLLGYAAYSLSVQSSE